MAKSATARGPTRELSEQAQREHWARRLGAAMNTIREASALIEMGYCAIILGNAPYSNANEATRALQAAIRQLAKLKTS